jgi:glycyl-tRNA synthetase beta chain
MREMLLVELLTEELPPRSLGRLGEAFYAEMRKSLSEGGFIDSETPGRWFATPRRLALQFDAVLEVQPDRTIERKGPALASGLDAEGRPTKALEGFVRSAGVALADLERTREGKAEYFLARIRKAGEHLDQHLPALVEAALKKLPVAKIMRWGDGDAEFVRPVHKLIMMHGARIVPGTVLGLRSANVTSGHRFMSAGDILIAHARDYESRLEVEGAVIASFAARRGRVAQLLEQAVPAGATWLRDEALLDEVTALVEHPTVYMAEFEAEFLQVPQECLILTMKQNQKYFPLLDANGKLLNRFLIVSNMRTERADNIIGGNARVVRARLADARFFFEQDRRNPLASRLAKLGAVVYHNKLGSQGDRVQRLERLAGAIARLLSADVTHAARAARLAKADLVADMVGEFPELQGVMGRYYAQHDGEAQEVADAIEAHYRPRFAGDALPRGNVACAVALADKLDALVGFFGIGQVPTGDKDPFGLRRAALGVLRILAETPLPLDLRELIDCAAQGFPAGVLQGGFAPALHEFVLERLRNMLREAGHGIEAVDAVLAGAPTRIDLVPPRLAAVREFVKLPEAEALAAANKRIANILKKSAEHGGEPDVLLFQEDAERGLFQQMNQLAPLVRSQVAADDYAGALRSLAGLRAAVDHFFDEVMVMAEEPLTRQNRLALLRQLAGLMNQVADISRLSA